MIRFLVVFKHKQSYLNMSQLCIFFRFAYFLNLAFSLLSLLSLRWDVIAGFP